MKTPDPQSPGPSASLSETEMSPQNTEGVPDASDPAAERDTQMEYSLISCAAQV
jgi:hypothetical protein